MYVNILPHWLDCRIGLVPVGTRILNSAVTATCIFFIIVINVLHHSFLLVFQFLLLYYEIFMSSNLNSCGFKLKFCYLIFFSVVQLGLSTLLLYHCEPLVTIL